MKCPNCESLKVEVYGGHNANSGSYMRYRRCLTCKLRFKTYERYRPRKEAGNDNSSTKRTDHIKE